MLPKMFHRTFEDDRSQALQKEYDGNPHPCVHPETHNPTGAWHMIEPFRKVKTVKPVKLDKPTYVDKVVVPAVFFFINFGAITSIRPKF